MSENNSTNFARLYAGFEAPIAAFDCGKKCAPYNERGVPFCCDTQHAVPAVYQTEWEYLENNTDLWHLWQGADPTQTEQLKDETPEGMLLLECLGHRLCQRGFRSLSCRAFPFFPYLDSSLDFIGLSVYWEYQDRCWVISNLQVVTGEYRQQFINAFDRLFAQMPGERDSYTHHSAQMRRQFARQRRTIPLLHRDGEIYKISPSTERMRRVQPENLPKFGPYKIAAELPFPDELPFMIETG
jgi:hypothetical protein